ncbi:glycosyl transferase family 4 [Candidatus Woesearchaeota archaeon]|nr:glycosyl transferase family 4 [Candidatus Woesearchaeota archaeon]MBT5739706.1 glycosyl transferase family 4 [Candidatus Woesearchaeota archaeon]
MFDSQILPVFAGLFIIVFIISLITTKFWIKRAKQAGLTGKDIHKKEDVHVAESGGIAIILSFIIGVLIYIAIRVFFLNASSQLTPILALLTAVLIGGMIGLIDDILGWKLGLKQWQKPLLTLLIAAPIVAINIGNHIMSIPFLGQINVGLWYPFLIVPGFIIVGANGFNMLAGYNGLEAFQGVLILSALSIISALTGATWVSVIGFVMVAALFGFLCFNKYPSKIFPGDTLTYTVGTTAAILAILSNNERFFVIIFIPYIIEFFLKFRGKFKKESFSQIQENNTLRTRYKKFYGLEHIAVRLLNKTKIKATEKKVVIFIHLFQLLFILIAFLI